MPMLRQPLSSWTAAIGLRARRTLSPQTQEDVATQRQLVVETQARAIASAIRVVLLVVAASLPVLSISAHVFGVITIDKAARFLVLPMAIVALVVALGRSPEGRLFRRAVVAGIISVTIYDCTRWPFVISGVWPDFIPSVGGWVVPSDEPSAFLGYFWRYLGNGGGIAAAFMLGCAVLGIRRHLLGLAIGYGVFPVWTGLMATVTLAPNGENLLFELSPLTFVMSLVGHLVYGAVLGWLFTRMLSRDPSLIELSVSELAPIAWLRRTRVIRALS
jgi:hypothetical protein